MVDLTGSFAWSELNVDERKQVWYAHLDAGGQLLTFDDFTLAMNQISHLA